jgi:hypothetical protein
MGIGPGFVRGLERSYIGNLIPAFNSRYGIGSYAIFPLGVLDLLLLYT